MTVIATVLAFTSFAIAAPVIEPKDQPIVDAFVGHAKAEAAVITPQRLKDVATPETLCWQHFPRLNMSLTAFELTGDRKHLGDFMTAFGRMKGAMEVGPDGMMGWYGKPIPTLVDPAKPDVRTTEIQTDFRAIGVLGRFIALTKNLGQYGDVNNTYRDLIDNHLLKKWDSYYSEIGDGAAVYRWNKDYLPLKANITLSHEKQSIMIEGLLNMYRATGDAKYRDRAEALGKFLKRSMKDVNGHYTWNFWDLGGDWDREDNKPDGKVRHWIAAEPQGVWYAATVGSAVLLYHHGLVFDEADIAKLRKTQMDVCWNGDLQQPTFKMVDGNEARLQQQFVAPSLAPWEPKLAELLYTGAWQEERLAKTKDAWHGGVIAGEWLRGKYLILPAAKDGKRMYVDAK
jgi:hypothetical protein